MSEKTIPRREGEAGEGTVGGGEGLHYEQMQNLECEICANRGREGGDMRGILGHGAFERVMQPWRNEQ